MIAAVVLAAGRSRRMGGANKLLVVVNGKPLLAHAVDAALASRAVPVVVVTGFEAERIRAALGARPVVAVHAADFAAGLSASLRAGLGAVPAAAAGALVCPGDMPRLTAAVIDRILDAFDGHRIVAPIHAGRRGHPVLLPRRIFPEVMALTGDGGARPVLDRHGWQAVAVEDDAVLADVDSPADLTRLERAAQEPVAVRAVR